MYGWSPWWMWLTGVLTLVALAWLVASVARGAGRPDDSASARRILDERLARGEVDRDEYGERLAALQRR